MTAWRTSSDGYTLVELVVVMLLLGMIALACESGLHFGAQVWTRTEVRTQSDDAVMISQTVLRTLLAHSLPRMKGDYVTFEGEPTDVRFDVVPPQAFEAGGTAHAELHVVRLPSKAQLVLDMQSIANPGFKRRAVLLGDAGLMRFSYLDASGKSATWLSYWRDRSRLPDAIRITASDPKLWPTLIARPILVQSATCILDSVDLKCRTI